MRDFIEMKYFLEALKGHYIDKARKIDAKGDKATPEETELRYYYAGKAAAFNDVIKMITETLAYERDRNNDLQSCKKQ